MFLTFALMEHSPDGAIFIENTILDQNFWKGEVWRLFSYAFLQNADVISLFFHILVFAYIASPLEALWGSRFFLSLYLVSVVGGGMTALLFGFPLSSGWHVDLTLMLLHGFLFPESQIFLFFFFPVKIKHLALVFTVIFLMNAVAMGLLTGLVFFLGMLCGVLHYFLAFHCMPKWYQIRWQLKRKSPMEHLQEMASGKLYEKARKVAQDIKNQKASPEDKEWFENLDKDFVPDREICSPYSFCPNSKICPPCSCFRFCVKRDLKEQTKAPENL